MQRIARFRRNLAVATTIETRRKQRRGAIAGSCKLEQVKSIRANVWRKMYRIACKVVTRRKTSDFFHRSSFFLPFRRVKREYVHRFSIGTAFCSANNNIYKAISTAGW